MIRLLLVAFICLLADSVFAQQNCPATPAPGTSNTTCANTAFVTNSVISLQVNSQTGTSYTIKASDYGHLVIFSNASPVAVTLPAASSTGFYPFNFTALNLGAGAVTITPASGTIGGQSSLVLNEDQSANIGSDTTNWQALPYVGPGIFANNLNIQTSNYSIAASDCGKTVLLGTGSTGQFTVTLPAVTGFPPTCTVGMTNGDSGRAKALAGSATICSPSNFLWPGQSCMVGIVNGAWAALSVPGRYQISGPTLYVAASGCSNSNDGLSSAAPLCSINTAIGLLKSSFDSLNANPTVQLADGNYTEAVSNVGQSGSVGDGIVINGNASTNTNVLLEGTSGNAAISVRDYGILFIENMELACNGAPAVESSQFATIDLINVYFGTCTGWQMIQAFDGGHVDLDGNIIIGGNAVSFAYTIGVGSEVQMQSQTLTCTAGWAFTYFVEASNLSEILATGSAFSGCSGVSGQRYLGVSNAVINTNGGGATFFPGTVGGSVSTGAVYE